jgi:hypothetical protein
MTQYLNWRRTRGDAMGLFNLMREQYAELLTARGKKMPWEI